MFGIELIVFVVMTLVDCDGKGMSMHVMPPRLAHLNEPLVAAVAVSDFLHSHFDGRRDSLARRSIPSNAPIHRLSRISRAVKKHYRLKQCESTNNAVPYLLSLTDSHSKRTWLHNFFSAFSDSADANTQT